MSFLCDLTEGYAPFNTPLNDLGRINANLAAKCVRGRRACVDMPEIS
jgi:hypothetical protein